MSERGSFVTEYISCDLCLQETYAVLQGDGKYLKTIKVPMWAHRKEFLPIIAGKIGGFYGGEELHAFEFEFIPALEKVICHPVRIAVLAEVGERIFTAHPKVYGKE